jgi:uncharacterized OB-fold protein
MSDELGVVPAPGVVGDPFWEGTEQHELRLQRCRPHGHFWHPPGELCAVCHSDEYDWVPASGRGVVHSWTTVHHAAHKVAAPWIPYTILLVDLDEGPRVVSLYRGDGEPSIGQVIHVRFEPYSEVVLPVFGPEPP